MRPLLEEALGDPAGWRERESVPGRRDDVLGLRARELLAAWVGCGEVPDERVVQRRSECERNRRLTPPTIVTRDGEASTVGHRTGGTAERAA
jgi:hypothetical protein